MSQSNEENSTTPSPTQPSIFSAEVRSPTLSTSFSQADTLLTSRTHYTANTGGRARQSWRNSINGLWRTPSFLSNEPNRSAAHRSNSVAGNSINTTGSPGVSPQTRLPAIELPASPVAGPDEPRSFFDSDSEGDEGPVLSRASSVRAQRPQLVEHTSSASGRSLRVYGASPRPSMNAGPPVNSAQQAPGSLYTLYDVTPQAQRRVPDDTRPGPSISKAQQLLGIPLNDVVGLTPAVVEEDRGESIKGPAQALEALTANAVDAASTTGLAPTPSPKSDLSDVPTSIIEIPNTPSRIEALSTLPSSMGGFGTLRMPHGPKLETATVDDHQTRSPRKLKNSATDGLRSNPIKDSETSRLHRATSAPPLPFRHPHRKVTIRPLDLEAAGEYRIRQSVVSTPYPLRSRSLAVDAMSPLSVLASTKTSPVLPPTSEEPDHFPLPPRTEVLYLELAVARHHPMTTLVQITVQDRSIYDDEALFIFLRKSHSQTFLGMLHYLVTARTLSSVTFTDPMFDAPSFLRHLHSPKLGHKRKTWLCWLREHQVKPRPGSSNTGGSEKSLSFHSPASTPRMPFFKTHKAHPRLTFHFEFSLPRIALAVIGTIVMSSFAAILWVLFGVPGLAAGKGRYEQVTPVEKWQLDAQARVLTGLVLGILVALLGTLSGAGWIAGSWLLL